MQTKAKSRILTPKQVEKIHSLHLLGRSERKIAEVVGCSRSAVWGRLQAAKR